MYQAPVTRGGTVLEETNWDFPESKTSRGIHALHPYPARFIPEIPRKLLQLYPPKAGTWIFDPFCGSGTTLVEAVQAGLNAVGVDINPLACLIARVKTTRLPAEFQGEGERVLSRARELLKEKVRVPAIPNLDHWFAPVAQQELSALVTGIGRVDQKEVREALMVALSRIVVEVSYQESDTRYAAVPKDIERGSVLQAFAKSVTFVDSCFAANSETKLFGEKGRAIVMHHDTLTLQPADLPGPVGLVITSPPYPNAYEYWLYHKYRMYWLGMNPISAKHSEIGARPHYFTGRRSSEPDFEKQMGTCFSLLSNVMDHGSRACFVISNSVIHGTEVDNTMSLTRAANLNGFVLEDKTSRRILQHRRSFNVRRNRKEEFLLVFRRER
jgi:DNA modification methylase